MSMRIFVGIAAMCVAAVVASTADFTYTDNFDGALSCPFYIDQSAAGSDTSASTTGGALHFKYTGTNRGLTPALMADNVGPNFTVQFTVPDANALKHPPDGVSFNVELRLTSTTTLLFRVRQSATNNFRFQYYSTTSPTLYGDGVYPDVPTTTFTGSMGIKIIASASSFVVQYSTDGGSTWTEIINRPFNPGATLSAGQLRLWATNTNTWQAVGAYDIPIDNLTLINEADLSGNIRSCSAEGEGEGEGEEPYLGVRFGVNSFLGCYTHNENPEFLFPKPTAEDHTNYLNAVRDLGATSVRESFMNWREIEPVRGGAYLFQPYDDIARKASDRGIEIVALAYFFPGWAMEVTPDNPYTDWRLPGREFEQDFRDFVAAFVRRYCGQYPDSLLLAIPIRKWIFTNELDAFGVSPDEYAFWSKVFWEEVKNADPGAKVITMGFCNVGSTAFLEGVLDSPALTGPDYPYFDVVDLHVYPGLNAGSIYAMNSFADIIRLSLASHGIDVPLWLDETGDRSLDQTEQGLRAMKYLVHAASVGVRRVHLHGLWDIGDDDRWGVLENTPSGQVPVRKRSFTAFQTFLKKIGNNRGVEYLGSGQYRAFLPDSKTVYVLWSEGSNTAPPEFLPGKVRVTSLWNVERITNVAELSLTGEPVFVEMAIDDDPDSDDDGLSDVAEVGTYHTNPNDPDSDDDGLSDYVEVMETLSDPNDADTDDDGLSDSTEVNIHHTDPNNADTDSDAVPDGWEISNNLNPLLDDAAVDADGDGLTNLEEFLLQRDPQDALDPPHDVYADVLYGNDQTGDGSAGAPWRTISFAMTSIEPYATINHPVTVHAAAGTYTEQVRFASHTRLAGAGTDLTTVAFYGTGPNEHIVMIAAEDTALRDCTVMAPSGVSAVTVLIQIQDVSMVIENVVLDGNNGQFSIAVLIDGPGSSASVIQDCTIRQVNDGIWATDSEVNVARNTFENILRHAVFVRPPTGKIGDAGATPLLGNAEDAVQTGFNQFGNVYGKCVMNNTSSEGLAELNDWGVYTEAEIALCVAGTAPVDYDPWIGKSVVPGTIAVEVFDSETNEYVLGEANPYVEVDGEPVESDDSSGLFLYIGAEAGTYTVKAFADGYDAETTDVVLAESEIKVVPLYLDPSQPTLGAVHVTVTDAQTSAPIAGATVVLLTLQDVPVQDAVTDASGVCVFADVVPGGYRVTGSAAGYVEGSQETAVSAGGVSQVGLMLGPIPATVTGVVTDKATSDPIEGAQVALLATKASTETNSEGLYVFANVMPGFYDLTVSAEGYETDARNIQVKADTVERQDFELIVLSGEGEGEGDGEGEGEGEPPRPGCFGGTLRAGTVPRSPLQDNVGNLGVFGVLLLVFCFGHKRWHQGVCQTAGAIQ